MNLQSVLDFIKEKRGYDSPFRYKLVYGIPLSKDDLYVHGNLFLFKTKLKSLPDNFTIRGILSINDTNLIELPDNLFVGDYLDVDNTFIETIPNNLYVGRFLSVIGTPLGEKYSVEEIRKMIEDKGGTVVGNIYR